MKKKNNDYERINSHEEDDPRDKIFGPYFWVRIGISIFITLLIFLLCYFLEGRNLLIASNASFGNLAIMLCFAFCSFFNRKGYFDGMGYAVMVTFSFVTRQYRGSYGDYVEYMKERRGLSEDGKWPFMAYLIMAGIWLIVAVVCYSLFKVSVA